VPSVLEGATLHAPRQRCSAGATREARGFRVLAHHSRGTERHAPWRGHQIPV
jgi:hypothetical protein